MFRHGNCIREAVWKIHGKNGIKGETPEEENNMESSIREIQGFARLEKIEFELKNIKLNLDKDKILAIIELPTCSLIKVLKKVRNRKYNEFNFKIIE